MKGLTKRQQETLDFIKRYYDVHSYPPTIREVASQFGISVKGSYDHIKALEKKGYIRSVDKRSRAIEILDRGDAPEESPGTLKIPVLANVAAGQGILSEQNYDGAVEIPESFVGSGNFFAVNIQGDSMKDAGILDGDVAIIREQQMVENGEIAVALVNEGYTLKRFYKEKNRVRLQPENDAMSPIYTRNVKVLGKLSCIIRNYER